MPKSDYHGIDRVHICDSIGVWIWSPPVDFTIDDHADGKDTEAVYRSWGDAEPDKGTTPLGDARLFVGSRTRAGKFFIDAGEVLNGAHFAPRGEAVNIVTDGYVLRTVRVYVNAKTGLQRWVVLQARDFNSGGRIARARKA